MSEIARIEEGSELTAKAERLKRQHGKSVHGEQFGGYTKVRDNDAVAQVGQTTLTIFAIARP